MIEVKGRRSERQSENFVKMPTKEQMTQKLEDGGFLGTSDQTDRFYNRFVEMVADSKKVGAGLNMAWELAKYDTLAEYPPIIAAIVDIGYEKVIDTVTSDPGVANQAKKLRKKMLEELAKKWGK